MNFYSKVFAMFALAIILLQFASLSFIIAVPFAVAEVGNAANPSPDIRDLKIEIPFGDLQSTFSKPGYQACSNDASQKCLVIPWIAQYISAAYKYAVVLGSVIAVVSMMFGGIMYVVAGANASMVSKAHEMIKGPVLGLVLLLGSYLLLQTVNPNLVYLQPIEIPVVKQATIAGTYCSQMDAEGFVPEGDWRVEGTCGKTFPLKSKDGSKSAGSQNCVSDYCSPSGSGPQRACIQDVANGQYRCANVSMYGSIIYPDGTNMLLNCGSISKAIGDGYYVEEVSLYEVCGTTNIAISTVTPVGVGKHAYYIQSVTATGEANSLSAIKSNCCTNCTDDQAKAKEVTLPILLKVNVHNANYFLLPSFLTRNDKPFFVSTTKITDGANRAVLATECEVSGQYAIYAQQDKRMTVSSSGFTRGDLVLQPARWDLDIATEMFTCTDGTIKNPVGWDCSSTNGLTGKPLIKEQYQPTSYDRYDWQKQDSNSLSDCSADSECKSGACTTSPASGATCSGVASGEDRVCNTALSNPKKKCTCRNNTDCVNNYGAGSVCNIAPCAPGGFCWNWCSMP
ncbi:MAG: hypothetical protein V1763_01580 [Parcubacteria group bacterium]